MIKRDLHLCAIGWGAYSMSRSRYPKLTHDADGKPLCRGCKKPVPKGRRTWCSYQCFRDHHPRMVSRAVFRRDKGICAECGCDTEKLREETQEKCRTHIHNFGFFAPSKNLSPPGFPIDTGRPWWEADHIIEFADGGETVLANMQTLCIPCHRAKTKRFLQRQAAKRKPNSQLTMTI